MATGTTFNDREYLFRLQTLIIDGGTDILRNIFDQKVQLHNVSLNVFLANEKTLINRLRGQKTITTTQYHQLYPPGGQQPNSSDFDITLIICLLRNLPSLGLNRNYSWHVPPQPADTSVEADLYRLKGFRNEVAHISSTTGFQQTVFLKKWTEIEQVLLRLNQATINPVPNLAQAIGSYKISSLDPVAEKRIQAEIKQWRKMEKGLETEMQLIKDNVRELKKSVEGVAEDVKEIKELKEGVKTVEENVGEVTLGVKNVKENILKVKEDILEVEKDVKEVKEGTKHMTVIKDGIREVKENVEDMKQDVKNVEGNIVFVKEDLGEVKKNVKIVTSDIGEVKGCVEEVNVDVKNLKEGIVDVQVDMGEVKTDVKKINAVTEDVNALRGDIGEVKQNVEEVMGHVKKVTEDVKRVEELQREQKETNEANLLKGVSDKRIQKKPGIFRLAFRKIFISRRTKERQVTELPINVTETDRDYRRLKTKRQVTELPTNVTETDADYRRLKTERQVPELPTNVTETDADYRRLKTELQDDLISFYRDKHTKITLSPLVEEDTPLLEFYVMPDIKSVEIKRARGGGTEEKTLVSPFRNVFYRGDKLCREIYLTADAGLGKTALCKRMALAWCHAKQTLKNEKHYFSEEEIEAMNEFRFVFLLLLRDSSSQCDIDAMIMEQIISRLGRDYTLKDLKDIQCKEKCLVILDGLDEYSHPSNSCTQGHSNIPHRKARDCTVVLTTTRPWKISVCGLKPSDIDQRLEISGLNQESASALKSSVISHLSGEKDKKKLKNDVREFSIAVQEKQISDLEAIPLLLMYLLFLWYYKIELGQSQCDLYSKIVELLLSRTVLKYKDTSSLAEPSKGDIPQCFTTQTRCRQFYSLLTALGQLAFQTLFKGTKEDNTLVFDSSVAEQYLNKDCLTFCLSTGIITQSKVQGNPMKQESKVSFAHKTVQEFFAALYMHSTLDHTSVAEIVASKCKCVKDILDMSTILKFIIGMKDNVASSISRELKKIINEDEITREYRSTLSDISDFGFVYHPLKDFQNMCISCCKELPRENEVSLCLQDVFIEGSCEQEQYREHLKQLTTRNTQNIRSLYTNTYYMKRYTPFNSVQEVVEYFALNGLENIEKIDCQGERNGGDILPLSCLLYRSVKCLVLSSGQTQGYWSRLLCEKVASLQKLEAINISGFAMSHSEWTLLCDYISHRHCMRQIVLEGLHCTDHGWLFCTGASLDLSQHSQLSELKLWDIPARTVKVNMAALEKCWLHLANEDPVLRFVNCDPANSKLNTFKCRELQSHADIDTILDTLPGLHQVKHVGLLYINLGDRELKLSPEMKNLERVELFRVTMAASSLRGVVDCVDQLPQTVKVEIYICTITPEREFVTVREKIKTSSRFRVSEVSTDWFGRPIKDWKGEDGRITVKFATIKE